MAQFQPPVTFTAGQVLTASALNAHVSSAILLPGAVTDQTDLAANTVAAGDSLIIHDLSALALREATASDLLNSGLPVTASTATIDTTVTSVVNGKANKDINLTPNDGVAVTGKVFTSVDGITAVVTSVAHGLETGMLLDITASNPVYTGQFFITVVSVDTFSFVVSQTTPVAASGTLDYTKKATVKSYGNHYVSNKLNVAGNLSVNGTSKFTGNSSITGNLSVSGTANFVGGFQVGGSSCYVLYEVYEETLPAWVATVPGNQAAVVTTASFTKPANEIWEFEIDGTWTLVRGYGAEYAFRYSTETFQTGSYLESDYDFSSGVTALSTRSIHHKWTVPVGTALSARTVVVDVSVGAGSQLRMFQNTPVYTAIITTGSLPVSMFRIYKYKTV